MKTAFIETSAINWFYDKEIDGFHANKLLEQKGLIPIVGMDTVYELARCFLVDSDKGQGVFNFLNQLNPVYACTRDMLYRRELDKFLLNFSFDPLLGYYTKECLMNRLSHYKEGNFEDNHKDFIDARQFFWSDCREKLWQPGGGKSKRGLLFKNYVDDCFNFIKKDLVIFQHWIHGLIKRKLSTNDASRLLLKINGFPALHTALLAQFYVNYLIARNGVTPREDRFTDSLQLIGASYSSVIVSDDQYLITTLANNLNPKIEAKSVKSIVEYQIS